MCVCLSLSHLFQRLQFSRPSFFVFFVRIFSFLNINFVYVTSPVCFLSARHHCKVCNYLIECAKNCDYIILNMRNNNSRIKTHNSFLPVSLIRLPTKSQVSHTHTWRNEKLSFTHASSSQKLPWPLLARI